MSLVSILFIFAALLMLATGLYGLIATHNLIRILISIELMTKAATLLMILAGHLTGHMAAAQSYVITIIVLEVMILAVATGIVYGIHKNNGTLSTEPLNKLKG